jgi:hypothetical protein
MIDMTPDNSNRIAYVAGLMFHPYLVSMVTLFAVLRDLEVAQAIGWVAGMTAILLIPVMVMLQIVRRRQKYAYQRLTRTNLYALVLGSVFVCIGIILLADGPRVLLACFVGLLIWLPVQFAINTYYTKISIHAAITAGCATALTWLGVLDTGWLVALAVAIVIVTGWARHKTYNHTFQQIVLGWTVSILAVLIAFPLVL